MRLRLSPERMREAQVFLPSDIELLCANDANASGSMVRKGSCVFGCENIDTLDLTRKKYYDLKRMGVSEPKILVLNMASPVHAGGRVRDGAAAQEEELCRRTSLLMSLESNVAKKYYDYNNAHKTHIGSDAVIISPNTEVVKNAALETLPETFTVSVMSCAAPMMRLGLGAMTEREYEEMLYGRICGMLTVAAAKNYSNLILGAFGCGIFGNDAALVSDLFYRAFEELPYFDYADFAVLCRAENDYNYREFCRNFSCEQK